MKAEQIYTAAKNNGVSFYASCSSVSRREWDRLIAGTTKANGARIRRIIKQHAPDVYESLALDYYNPFEHQSRKKPGMLIYVHSGIEYFFHINK